MFILSRSIALGLVLTANVGAAERTAYKHVDEKGNVTYSQTPPADGREARRIDVSPANAGRGGYVPERNSPYPLSAEQPRRQDVARKSPAARGSQTKAPGGARGRMPSPARHRLQESADASQHGRRQYSARRPALAAAMSRTLPKPIRDRAGAGIRRSTRAGAHHNDRLGSLRGAQRRGTLGRSQAGLHLHRICPAGVSIANVRGTHNPCSPPPERQHRPACSIPWRGDT